jgi:hypothetical protein
VRYRYVGPADVAAAATTGPGRAVRSAADFTSWASAGPGPFTYVVDLSGVLRLAPRESEHVACAEGGEVLAAGEVSFTRDGGGWRISEVSNQSTGYCPDPSCWPAVAAAAERAGFGHPGGFTAEFVFRRCPGCGQICVVKEGDFTCAVCGSPLPVWVKPRLWVKPRPGAEPAALDEALHRE